MLNKLNKKKNIFLFILLFLHLSLLIEKSKKNIIKNDNSNMIDKEKRTFRIPVFTFHRLVPNRIKKKMYSNSDWIGNLNTFKEMIKYIYYNGYKTLSTKEFYKWYKGEVEYDKKTILITFDDGNFEDYYLAYPIIKKYNMKSTSFIIGSKIKSKTPPYNKYSQSYLGIDVINKVRKEYPDFEFQSHSFNMHFGVRTDNNKYKCRIFNMSYEELEDDIIRNKDYGFTSMAYPYGCVNKKVMKILENYGYLNSFSFGPSEYATRNCNRFSIPRIKLKADATLETLKFWLKNI